MEGRDRIPVVEIEGRAEVLKNNLWQVKLGLPGVPCMRSIRKSSRFSEMHELFGDKSGNKIVDDKNSIERRRKHGNQKRN